MAKIKISTQNKIVVVFQSRELARYSGLTGLVERHNGVTYVNTYLPFMTWQGHDTQVVEDVIEAVKLLGNYAMRMQGQDISWSSFAHPATIMRPEKIRFPVYALHSDPHVQAERIPVVGKEGFVKWSVDGHFFNSDVPSMRAYVAALTKLRDAVKENHL